MADPAPLLYTDPRSGELRRRRWRLEVIDGIDQGLKCTLEHSPALIGAAPAAALVLNDDTASRYHLELDLFAEGIRLRDLDSTNGTFVGTTRIHDAFIEAGDVFRVGRSVIRAEASSEAAAPEIETDPRGIPLGGVERLGEAIAVSEAMRAVFEKLRTIARSPSPVLLSGEPGVGKATTAAIIHQLSPRKAQPFVALDIDAALTIDGAEDALFGRADPDQETRIEGAFDRSNGGTLLLGGVDHLRASTQRKLLGAIESGEILPSGEGRRRRVNVRLLTTLSSRDAADRIEPKLLHRLAVVRLTIPPLRERAEDLIPLARLFLGALDPSLRIGARLEARLRMESWPGNLAQLRRELEALASPGRWIPNEEPLSPLAVDLRRAFVADFVGLHQGNVGRAAGDLAVPKRALFGFLTRHKVELDAL
ncbi:MAG: sigma 54-dependent Fis family transcriptional regulator [Deltaproteobacteria bacterium]|nr:sigma 54-dependent Fis family transcriptional regulator [Deltaproteobacteria bacterium]